MSKFTQITGKMWRGRVMKIIVFKSDSVRMFISMMAKSHKITNKRMFPSNDHPYKRCRTNLIDENPKVERSLLWVLILRIFMQWFHGRKRKLIWFFIEDQLYLNDLSSWWFNCKLRKKSESTKDDIREKRRRRIPWERIIDSMFQISCSFHSTFQIFTRHRFRANHCYTENNSLLNYSVQGLQLQKLLLLEKRGSFDFHW